MKTGKQRTFNLVTRAAIAAIFGVIVFVACDDGNGKTDSLTTDSLATEPLTLEGTITISPATATTGTLLTANYKGSETVSYQWNKDGIALNGKTTATLTADTAGSYTVTVSANGYNSKTSDTVTVTVRILDLPGTITITPDTATTGNTLTANYSGTETVSYQWNKDGTILSGKTAKTLIADATGNYTVTVSASGYNSKTSAAVEVTTPVKSFTVTFNANGGSPTPNKQTITNGGKATEPQGVTKDKNTLDGWYKEAALTNKWNFSTDTVTADITLYAKWQPSAGSNGFEGTTWVQNGGGSYQTTVVFETASTYRVSYKGLQHPHPTGTYTVNGNILTMTDETGSQNYVISGNTFSWSMSGFPSITWTKQ
jgi:uncharacterized repeat protein (TIGR02543 family)